MGPSGPNDPRGVLIPSEKKRNNVNETGDNTKEGQDTFTKDVCIQSIGAHSYTRLMIDTIYWR